MEGKKKIVYVDMDGVLVDFDSGLKQAEPDLLRVYKGQLDNIPHLFSWLFLLIPYYPPILKHFA